MRIYVRYCPILDKCPPIHDKYKIPAKSQISLMLGVGMGHLANVYKIKSVLTRLISRLVRAFTAHIHIVCFWMKI